MESVSVSRKLSAPPEAVRARLDDIEPFMRATGADTVAVDGDRIELANRVGITTVELELERFDEADAALAYRQREGIFEEMVSRYTVEPAEGGSEVTATTEFAVDVALVGKLLDATVIERKRRQELRDQLDWLAAELD